MTPLTYLADTLRRLPASVRGGFYLAFAVVWSLVLLCNQQGWETFGHLVAVADVEGVVEFLAPVFAFTATANLTPSIDAGLKRLSRYAPPTEDQYPGEES